MKSWLQKQTTIEEAERDHLVMDERLGPSPVPFGFLYHRWLSFKEQIRQGDQLWRFCSPAEWWKHLGGREGLCIVRGGEVVGEFVTRKN